MALNPALNPKDYDKFDPRVFDELAFEVAKVEGDGEDREPINPQVAKTMLMRQRLRRALGLAKGHEAAWSSIIALLIDKARMYADRCSEVDPGASPRKIHGWQCYWSGYANGLIMAAKMLAIPGLESALKASLTPNSNQVDPETPGTVL